MAKSVKSTDPRKKSITNAIKAKSGAVRVTLVTENKDGTFTGHAMGKTDSKYAFQSLGMVTVTAEEAGLS